MWIFKALVRFVKLLNSETSTPALAAAFTLGMFLGIVPLLSLKMVSSSAGGEVQEGLGFPISRAHVR